MCVWSSFICSWDPKETWALITWLFYAVYLHGRIYKDWSAKKTAAVSASAPWTSCAAGRRPQRAMLEHTCHTGKIGTHRKDKNIVIVTHRKERNT